jgi:hypothetical protein
LPIDHSLRRNRRIFDGKQELECALEVPSGDEILRQLEGMAFGDESAGKTPDPTKLIKKDRKKKKKKKKEKKRKMKTNKKKEELAAPDILWKKKNIFFRLPYWKDNLFGHNLNVMHVGKKCDGQHTWHNAGH